MADLGTGYVTIKPDMAGFSAQLSAGVNSSLSTVGRAASTGLASSLSRAGSSLSSFGQKMMSAGRTATTYLTAPIVGIGVVAGKMAADFGQAMANVNTVLDVSGKKLSGYGDQILQLSTHIPQTADQLAGGFYDVASAGFKGADAMQIMKVGAEAASAGMTDAHTATTGIVQALAAYGKGASSARDVSDTLFVAVKDGLPPFQDFVSTMGQYVSAASQLKVPLTDVLGAQSAMTISGQSASEAATSLNNILRSMLNPSDALSKSLHTMGFESGQAALQQIGLQGVMQGLSDEVGNDKSKWIDLFPEIRAARGAMALTANDGETLNRVLGDMAQRTGAAGVAFGTALKGPQAQFQLAMNDLRKAAIDLGNTLIPIFTRDIVPAIQGVVHWFTGLSDGAKEWMVRIGAIVAVGGPLGILLGGLARLAGGALKVAGAFGKVLGIGGQAGAAGAAAGTAAALDGAAVALTEAAGAISTAAAELAAAGGTAGAEIEAGATAAAAELSASQTAGAVLLGEGGGAAATTVAPAAAEGGGFLSGIGLGGIGSGVLGGVSSIAGLLGLAQIPETPGGPGGLFQGGDRDAEQVAQFVTQLQNGNRAALAFVNQMHFAKAAMDAAASGTQNLTQDQQKLVEWWGRNAHQVQIASRAEQQFTNQQHKTSGTVGDLTDNILQNSRAQAQWGGWLRNNQGLTNHQAVSVAELTQAFYKAGGALNKTQAAAFQTALAEGKASQATHILNAAINQLPAKKQIQIEADTQQAQANVARLQSTINAVHGKTVTITVQTQTQSYKGFPGAHPGGHKGGRVTPRGIFPMFHSGGVVTADLLENEFVMQRSAVEALGLPLMRALNAASPLQGRRLRGAAASPQRSSLVGLKIAGRIEMTDGGAYLRGIVREEIEDNTAWQASLARRGGGG